MASLEAKRATVEAGMDILGWTYDEAFWRRWLAAQNHQPGFGKPSPSTLGSIGLMTLAGTAAAVLTSTNLVVEIGISLLGLPAAGLAFAAWRLLPRRGQRLRAKAPPPTVRITSTGLLFGDTPWLWHSHNELLAHAGIGHSDPRYLTFRFRRRRRFVGNFDYEVDVPLPPDIAEQAEELTREILRYKVSHTD